MPEYFTLSELQGVYETIHDEAKPANPSNCLHCKTC